LEKKTEEWDLSELYWDTQEKVAYSNATVGANDTKKDTYRGSWRKTLGESPTDKHPTFEEGKNTSRGEGVLEKNITATIKLGLGKK